MWRLRHQLKSFIRSFFEARSYIEVDTPILVRCPGSEVHLDYFETNWVDADGKSTHLYLRSSPELHMKQLLSEENRIYQFAKSFRNNGEMSLWHHPEFLMLEWYEADVSFEKFITQSYTLISEAERFFYDSGKISNMCFQTFECFSVFEAFKEFVGIDLVDQDPNLATKAIGAGNISVKLDDDFETVFFKVMLDQIEPAFKKLKAVVLYDYPISQSALAKIGSGVSKRFEIYLHGIEICNGYDELVDVRENKARFDNTINIRKTLGKSLPPFDEYFYDALMRGVPDCCGNAMGFDRLLASLLGQNDIENILPFRQQIHSR